MYIRQNATHKVVIGPAVAVGDGFTPVTTLSVATADEAEAILHDNGTVVDIAAYTFAAITTADGYYHLTLQSGISGTVGHMTVVINDDSLCLPVKAEFTVIEEAVYDAYFAAAATGLLPANVTQWAGQSTTLSANNMPDVNVNEWKDVLLATTNPLPNAAADAAGGLPISDAGGLDLDLRTLSAVAVVNLNASGLGIVPGICEGTPSTTVIQTDLAEATDDHYIGRVVVFTSGAAAGEASEITDYTGATGTLTVTAVTTAPAASDTFVII